MAVAHDGWIEVTPSIIEKGQLVTISLLHGNHSNEHKSYRLAGKWRPEFTTLMALDPTGRLTDLTGAIVDLGEDEEKTGPKGPKGFHIAQFTAKEQGFYAVLARQQRVIEEAGVKLRSLRTARTVFGALAIPTIAGTKELRWPTAQPTLGDGLEIVPITEPLGIAQHDSVTLEVRHKGTPMPNRVLTVVSKLGGPKSAQDLTSNHQGRVTFKVGPADLYLTRVKFDEEATSGTDGKKEKSSYEATFVFQVFNRP
jgi:uncharacterized GH25 family protein